MLDWVIGGGVVCGALAGAASRFGRLCTMSAIEDALIGGDYRGAKAWGLAIAAAIAGTEIAVLTGHADPSGSIYAGPSVPVLGALLGGALFGLGMTLVGTCSFGLLVRVGGGDLRALMTAILLGVAAVSVLAGALSPLREPLVGLGVLTLPARDSVAIGNSAETAPGRTFRLWLPLIMVLGLVTLALVDARLRRRWRLLVSAVALGLSIAAGWVATTQAVASLSLDRPESLSFVAPLGRALVQVMMEPTRSIGFGVSAAIGVVVASFGIALSRREFRWDAFDDATEMRRHMVGAVLMAMGGVLAQGCTIGQGLSAGSVLSLSMPLFVLGLLGGAKLGLAYLIEGHAVWRLGRA